MTMFSASAIARDYGFSARHWIRLAASGKVPGAYQPAGHGGKWLFDAHVFARWFKETNRRVTAWPEFINEAKPIGRGPKEKARNIEIPLRQQIDGLLSAVLSSGKNALKPQHGANVREFPLAKR